MAAKMLEIEFLDMDFCEHRLLPDTHSSGDVLRVESDILFYTTCELQQITCFDVYCNIIGLLKSKFQLLNSYTIQDLEVSQ